MWRRPADGSRDRIRAVVCERRPSPADPACLIPESEHATLQRAFRELAPVDERVEPVLRAVLEDTVTHPGGFLRAQVAFDGARRQGLDRDAATALAIAVEYFHTASLLFDDLPMMDDARERRGRPCPHRVYGEAATVLGALALINRAYGLLWQALADLPAERSRAASELVTSSLGALGIVGGQSRDLHLDPETLSESDIRAVALEKTVPLIRLTLRLPALVGGADASTLSALDRLATLWGLAYQALDDCRDALLESTETGKSTSRDELLGRPNLLNHAGADRTLGELGTLLGRSRVCLHRLTAEGGPWPALERLQRLLDGEGARIAGRLSRREVTVVRGTGGVEALAS